MSELARRNADYAAWFETIESIREFLQVRSVYTVNRDVLVMYWSLGEMIAEAEKRDIYGPGFMEALSEDLKAAMPAQRCLSRTNLSYMRRFYKLYKGLKPIEREELFRVPWGHHKVIMDKCRGSAERALYCLHETLAHGWTREYLKAWMNAGCKAPAAPAAPAGADKTASDLLTAASGMETAYADCRSISADGAEADGGCGDGAVDREVEGEVPFVHGAVMNREQPGI